MTISDPGIGGRKGGSVGICQKGARNGMMGMEAAVGWLVGWLEDKWWGDRRREGERRKGGSNDAFTFKSYFNSWLRLERKAYPATFIGQYFLRLIGCTCSAFPFPLSLSAKTNSYAIAVMSSAPQPAMSRGSDFSGDPFDRYLQTRKRTCHRCQWNTPPLFQSPISTFVVEI